ncbi:hypothetical protein J437_LFUL005740 [Ladona fulva]|uniref:Uncharacterized protein n=1 Tax=Ladona fulva TaxID=123851 RepID=A0A8K0JZY4_LADFU|nr:hypothetical protein J437_LFUL005740 [Ladona fulva]
MLTSSTNKVQRVRPRDIYKCISQLTEDVQRLQSSLAKVQEASAATISRLEEQLEQRAMTIARLEARLDTQRDYEELKREVR